MLIYIYIPYMDPMGNYMIDLSWSHHQLLPVWGVGVDCDPFSWYYIASTDCAAALAISSAAEILNQIGSSFPNILRYSFFLDLIPSSQIFPQQCPCTCRKQVRFLPGWSLSSLSPPMECSRWSAQSWWSLRRYPDGGDPSNEKGPNFWSSWMYPNTGHKVTK